MSNDLISIIVPTYNRLGLLNRTLTHLLDQSYRNIEIVVINDAGEDISPIIDSFNDKRIVSLRNENNLDLAATRNVGLKRATGDWICLCDDDDIYLQYALEFRLYMAKKLKADIVYTRALQDIWEKVEKDGNFYYKSIHKQLYWDSPFNKDLILVQNIAPCCCPMFSRKSWEDVDNLFDETLTTSEDWAFWVELSRKYNFHELKLIDCECSFRTDKTQMTGSRTGYTDHLPYLFKKWREYAINKDVVIQSQNNSLRARGLNPEDYGL